MYVLQILGEKWQIRGCVNIVHFKYFTENVLIPVTIKKINTLRIRIFSDNFIGCVKTIDNNIESTILINGNTGIYFKVQRGVRQGCPLSAYLFITTLEILANKIRNDTNIKGIQINNKQIKIILLADDITLILLDLDYIKNSSIILKKFSNCSGPKINVDKTKTKYIGSLMSCDHFPHGLCWIQSPLETLRITITDNAEANFKYNFQQRI